MRSPIMAGARRAPLRRTDKPREVGDDDGADQGRKDSRRNRGGGFRGRCSRRGRSDRRAPAEGRRAPSCRSGSRCERLHGVARVHRHAFPRGLDACARRSRCADEDHAGAGSHQCRGRELRILAGAGRARWPRIRRRIPGGDAGRGAARFQLAHDGRVSRPGGEERTARQHGRARRSRQHSRRGFGQASWRHAPPGAGALPGGSQTLSRRGRLRAELRPRLRPRNVLTAGGAGGLLSGGRRGRQARHRSSQGLERDLAHLSGHLPEASQPARVAGDAGDRPRDGSDAAGLALHLRRKEELGDGGKGAGDGGAGAARGRRRHDRRLSLHLWKHHHQRSSLLLVPRDGSEGLSLQSGARQAASGAGDRLPAGRLRLRRLPGDGCGDRRRGGAQRTDHRGDRQAPRHPSLRHHCSS